MADTAIAHAELKKKTALSVLWSVIRVAWSTIATFVIFVILARILGPGDFGTFALASLFVEIGRVLAYAGLGDAVTRQLDLDEELADTTFWATIAFSGIVASLVFFFAPYYGDLVRDPSVSGILRWLAPLLPISSLAVIHNARLAREFGHKSLAGQAIAASLLSGITAVVCAFLGWGVWALVAQTAVNAAVTVLLGWYYYPWMPKFRFNVTMFRSVFLFSISLVVTQLMWMLLARVQDIFISRWFGPVEVGRYRIAWRLIELIGQAVLAPIGSVSLVTLSRLQNDATAFRNAYNKIVGAAALGTIPLLLGFGALSNDMIALLFGNKWGNAGDIATVLVLMAVPFVMNFFASSALSAVNRAESILSVAALQLVTTLILTWLLVPYGVVAVAAGYTLRAWLTMPYQQYVLARYAHIDAKSTLKAVALPFCGAALMAVCVWFANPVILARVHNRWLALGLSIGLGGAIYLAFLPIFGRSVIRPYIALAMSLNPFRKQAEA
ncbi:MULTISPECIES: lipopolysaccharide biosynthesis protein [Rhizobium]|uniref:Teichuronic acid biosynthesis protein tuaB n=1 Tax=Rhizobium favelukesii TaxID=348824 RepID=W6RCQ3_9HYPH|nr:MULTISPECIES: lipopolysaccharide biosynthesis protein [Rhizobium]MCS0457305.1 lipopolysaccharide biosynthesis protein [Rhizobium favelukesii]UFS81900.1 lipopolysaccharide biosynthesis protein [Rhizobium sp. T136]CDM56433.1 Teichuronic acid biosynthesis protein tuaB [Rhizobium favelukesii]